MRSLFLLPLIFLCACRPAGDEARSREATSEGGALGSPDRGGGDPVAEEAENVVLPPVENITDTPPPPPPSPAPGPSSAPAPALSNVAEPAPAAVQAVIPNRYRGRWGLVAADCTSTRGDAKGLITVGDRTIRFYESVGTLAEARPAIATAFSGRFEFTGEGMNWERVITLSRTGDTLTRADEDGRFTYTRCG